MCASQSLIGGGEENTAAAAVYKAQDVSVLTPLVERVNTQNSSFSASTSGMGGDTIWPWGIICWIARLLPLPLAKTCTLRLRLAVLGRPVGRASSLRCTQEWGVWQHTREQLQLPTTCSLPTPINRRGAQLHLLPALEDREIPHEHLVELNDAAIVRCVGGGEGDEWLARAGRHHAI